MGSFMFTPAGCCNERCSSKKRRLVGVDSWTDDTFPNIREIKGSPNQYGYIIGFSVKSGSGGHRIQDTNSYLTGFDKNTRSPKIYTGDQTGRLASNYQGDTLCEVYNRPIVLDSSEKWYIWKKCQEPIEYRYNLDPDECDYSLRDFHPRNKGAVAYSDLYNYIDRQRSSISYDSIKVWIREAFSKTGGSYFFVNTESDQERARETITNIYNNNNLSKVYHYIVLENAIADLYFYSTLDDLLTLGEYTRLEPLYFSNVARSFIVYKKPISQSDESNLLVWLGDETSTYLRGTIDEVYIDGDSVSIESGDGTYVMADNSDSHDLRIVARLHKEDGSQTVSGRYTKRPGLNTLEEILYPSSDTFDWLHLRGKNFMEYLYYETFDFGYTELYKK